MLKICVNIATPNLVDVKYLGDVVMISYMH